MKRYFTLYSLPKLTEHFNAPSAKMLKTLKDCIQLEIRFPGKPYGSIDIKGSIIGLYNRGLLDIAFENKLKPSSWYVTSKGLLLLLSIADSSFLPNKVCC